MRQFFPVKLFQTVRAHLHRTSTSLPLGISDNEGLPHLEIHGVSALVELSLADVQPFCKLAGFNDGHIKTNVFLYGGYKWNLRLFDCAKNHSECFSGKLMHTWFSGVYIICYNISAIGNTGFRISNTFIYCFCLLVSCFSLASELVN